MSQTDVVIQNSTSQIIDGPRTRVQIFMPCQTTGDEADTSHMQVANKLIVDTIIATFASRSGSLPQNLQYTELVDVSEEVNQQFRTLQRAWFVANKSRALDKT